MRQAGWELALAHTNKVHTPLSSLPGKRSAIPYQTSNIPIIAQGHSPRSPPALPPSRAHGLLMKSPAAKPGQVTYMLQTGAKLAIHGSSRRGDVAGGGGCQPSRSLAEKVWCGRSLRRNGVALHGPGDGGILKHVRLHLRVSQLLVDPWMLRPFLGYGQGSLLPPRLTI